MAARKKPQARKTPATSAMKPVARKPSKTSGGLGIPADMPPAVIQRVRATISRGQDTRTPRTAEYTARKQQEIQAEAIRLGLITDPALSQTGRSRSAATTAEHLKKIQDEAARLGLIGGAAASTAGTFASGVSGATQQFITEAGQSSLAEGESEAGKTGPTKNKNKGKTKKLIKKASKKSGVKRKALRRAINTKGTSAAERKLYAKAPKKLSSKLRAADRRINRKGKR